MGMFKEARGAGKGEAGRRSGGGAGIGELSGSGGGTGELARKVVLGAEGSGVKTDPLSSGVQIGSAVAEGRAGMTASTLRSLYPPGTLL